MIVDELGPAGGIETGLVSLATALVGLGARIGVFSRAPVAEDNQYAVALARLGVPVVGAPRAVAAITRLDWRARERLLRVALAVLSPAIALVALADAALRRRSLARAWRGAHGRLRGHLQEIVHEQLDRLSYPSLDRALAAGRLPRPSVAHVHGYRCAEVPAGGVAWARGRGLPVVYHEQGVSHPGAVRIAPARAAHVAVAISRAVEEGLRQVCAFEGPIFRIPYIVEPRNGHAQRADIHSALPESWNERPVVGTVARLHPQKGHSTLLDAAVRVLAAQPEARFAFAGDGPLRAELEAQARRLGVDRAVAFLGTVDQADIPALVARLDVVAMPSRWEALGIAAVEAMMHAKPIVASDLEGLAELVEDGRTGLLVPPDDPDRLAAALLRLLADPALRHDMGQAGRRRYETLGVSSAAVAAAFLAAYGAAVEAAGV